MVRRKVYRSDKMFSCVSVAIFFSPCGELPRPPPSATANSIRTLTLHTSGISFSVLVHDVEGQNVVPLSRQILAELFRQLWCEPD